MRRGSSWPGTGRVGSVLVDERRDRHARAHHRADLAGPHARGVDHELGGDASLVGDDAGDRAVRDRSMPVTRTPVSMATPIARARRASSMVAPLGSI